MLSLHSLQTPDSHITCGCAAKPKATRRITTLFTFSSQAASPALAPPFTASEPPPARNTIWRTVSGADCKLGAGRTMVGAILAQTFTFNPPVRRQFEFKRVRMVYPLIRSCSRRVLIALLRQEH